MILPHVIDVPLPYKVKVKDVCLGYNFVILLSKAGMLYSFGKKNNFGVLGHGNKKPMEVPTAIKEIKRAGARISSVFCGFSHVIAKSARGKVFSWGSGKKG